MTLHAIVFFFYYYDDHPHLHSFPTRRSSDLQQPEDVPVVGEELRVGGDALLRPGAHQVRVQACQGVEGRVEEARPRLRAVDRKSTRLNSSHVAISYAVFCLKKKKKNRRITDT